MDREYCRIREMDSKTAFLVGEKVYLRPLTEEDVEGPYLSWFNDEEVCRGNSHHRYPFTEEEARAYILNANKHRGELILAIMEKDGDRHIGNIGLTNIDFIYRTAVFVMILGDKSIWAKGYGKEAATLLHNHAFFTMNLRRLYGGIMDNNLASKILIRMLGWKKEGVRRQAAFKNGKFLDIVEYGILRDEYLQLHHRADDTETVGA
jgi:[ribosomal protein S5]-alanine N-acetyltransferase